MKVSLLIALAGASLVSCDVQAGTWVWQKRNKDDVQSQVEKAQEVYGREMWTKPGYEHMQEGKTQPQGSRLTTQHTADQYMMQGYDHGGKQEKTARRHYMAAD